MSLDVLEIDLDRVALSGADICDDRGRLDLVALVDEGRDASSDDVQGLWLLAAVIWPHDDQLGLAVDSRRGGIREEFTVLGQLLLGEAKDGIQELVQGLLRLCRCVVAPSSHGVPLCRPAFGFVDEQEAFQADQRSTGNA